MVKKKFRLNYIEAISIPKARFVKTSCLKIVQNVQVQDKKITKKGKKISSNVICLPTETDFEDFDKTKCVATSWGKESMKREK